MPLGSPEEQPDDGSLQPSPMLDSGPQLEAPGSLLSQAARVVVGVAVVGTRHVTPEFTGGEQLA